MTGLLVQENQGIQKNIFLMQTLALLPSQQLL